MDSTDVNSALEKDLDSDDEKDNTRMESKEHVSSICLPNRLAEAYFACYGNEMVLLNVMYRTTRCALPFFFLVLKTNINYQEVAAFITMNESDCIKEALSLIKSLNQDGSPRYGMTDYCAFSGK